MQNASVIWREKMGRDYMARKSKDDMYETPYILTRKLMELEIFNLDKYVGEVACGKGAIVDILKEYFSVVDFYDKYISFSDGITKDFLKENKKYDIIITNPPFSLFDAFVMKAKEVVKDKFAFIARTNYFGAYKRNENGIWKHLREIHIFNRMVDYRYPLREDGKFYCGGIVTGWFIWDMSWNKNYWKTYIMDVQEYAISGKQEKIMEDEMKINYEKISAEAHRMGISPFLLVKRKYHYRLAKNENKCYNCVNMQHMNFHDGEKVKIQCAFIGESKTDRHADIDYNHTCNAFKKQLTE